MHSFKKAYAQYALLLMSSLILTTIGTAMGDLFIGYWSHPLLPFMISLVLLVAIGFLSGPLKKGLFFLFSFLEGVSLTPIIWYYLATDNQVLVAAVAVTTILIGVFLALGYWAKNLAPMGRYLLIGLIGLLLLTILQLFLPISIPFLMYVGLALFTAYIAYHINLFKRRLEGLGGSMSSDEITDHVMSQYLNIVNLFLQVLSLMDRD